MTTPSPRSTSSFDSTNDVAAWFAGRLPDDWFTGPLAVTTDRDEILVVGELAVPANRPEGDVHHTAERSRIAGFREDTRDRRMRVAAEAEQCFGRKVSWAVRCGEVEAAFTTASVPVMTRLRMQERATLDTLIDAGVARSRSEALGWCVRLVGRHQEDWIGQLREALSAVEQVRAAGPDPAT